MSSTEPTQTTLPCAVCRKPLEAMDGHPDVPYAANIFITHGHYGSTAYDTFGGEHLELLICTSCMTIMQKNSAIHRVFQATEEIPEQTFVWGSDEDPAADNNWNRQRLRNEFAMEDYLESTEGMNQEWAKLIFDACTTASRDGKAFDPASVPALTAVPGA